MDTNSYYIYQGRYNNGGSDGDTLYWTNFDLMTVDLGDPTASTYTIVDTGTTELSDPVHLMLREYDNGGAGYVPPEATLSDPNDSTANNEYWYDVGGACYVLGKNSPGHYKGNPGDSTYYSDGVIPFIPAKATIWVWESGGASPTGQRARGIRK